MTNFMRGLDTIAKGMMILTAFCAFGMAFLILVEVTARTSGIKFYGAAEYIRNALIVIIFLQLPYAVRIQSMLSVDILVGHLPRRSAVPLAIFGCLLGILFFGAVAAGAIGPAVDAWVKGEYEGEGVVDVPAWPAKFSIVVGCGLAAFYYCVRIVEIFKWGLPVGPSAETSAGL
jgi:TRAP-type C4-dicarboxylate transport system permease small subunit